MPAPFPDPGLLRAARQRMGSDAGEGRCGPYGLWTDLRDSTALAVCERIAGRIEEVYRQRYGLRLVGRPRGSLLVFADLAAFRRFASEDARAGLGHGGFALPSRGIVALHADGLSREIFAANLAHELAHLLERRSLGVNLPPWLSEGLADGISDTAGSRGFVPVRGAEGMGHLADRLREAYRSGRARSLRQLTALERGEFDRPEPGRAVAFDYEQSALLVRFLLDDPGRSERFRSFLQRVAAGEAPTSELLASELGRGLERLEEDFRRWLAPLPGS